jgi:hypothetical protein
MPDETPKKRKRRRTWVGVRAVARMLDCSEQTVARMVKRGQLSPPKYTADGARLWHVRDVAVYRWRFLRGDFDHDEPEPEENEEKPEKRRPKGSQDGG